MDEAEGEIVAFFFPAAGHAFVVGVELTLRVAETRVDERALGERVFVAEGSRVDLGVGDLAVVGVVDVGVHVADAGLHRAAENVERRGEMHAIAGVGNGTLVELDVAFVIVEDAVFVEEAHIVKDGTRVTGILEVLGGKIGLHEAEVIGTGEVERPGILKVHVRLEFGAVAVGDGGVLVRPVDESGEVEGAGLSFSTESGVAVVGSLVFVRVAHGVLGIDRHAGEFRRNVGDRVVIAARVVGHDGVVAGDVVGPARGQSGGHGAVEANGARVGDERAHAAGVDRTEPALDEERGFAVKQLAVRLEGARAGLEAVFKLEAHRHAVAEVFRAADAEAGGGVCARFHAEGVDFGAGAADAVDGRTGFTVLIEKARIDDTVHRDLGSHGSAGKSAENGESDKTLLHFFFPLMVDKRQSGRGSRRPLRTSSDSTAP